MNNQPNVGDVISFAWLKTKQILFPIQFKRWLKIFFIVWLAGQAGGFNFNIPNLPERKEEVAEEQTVGERATDEPTEESEQGTGTGTQSGEELDDTTGIPQTAPTTQPETGVTDETQVPPIPLGVWFVLIPLALAVGLLFAWLSARFNFILLELMQNRDVLLKTSFRIHKLAGNSYFLWALCFGLVAIVSTLAIVLLIGLSATFLKALLWLTVPLALALIIALVIIGVLVMDFVLPIMYQDKIRCMEACRKFLALKPAVGSVAIYFVVKIALGIVAMIIAFIVAFVTALAFIILGILIGVLGALLAAAVTFLKPVLIVLGILLLIPVVLAMLILIGIILLPIPIFFRAFALAYLAKLISQYDLLGFSPPTSDGPLAA
ncbi:MAG: hypothetical protein A3G87_00560 [Omnitrophica bacterium RIFCSPLOWO2_12_FULL_50_11]|nr:MAG: hypothetical protein A3G87_00560 [Omnitrophica bacterium RIFCSPLOWO2_12_FULL_50_11]